MGVARIPFDAMDEQRIASAGTWGLITAICSLVSVVITSAVTIPELLEMMDNPILGTLGMLPIVITVVGLIVTVLLDVWLIQASLAFRKVALTDEADQHYLLSGFSKLRYYFMVLGILLILMTVAFVGGMFAGLAS